MSVKGKTNSLWTLCLSCKHQQFFLGWLHKVNMELYNIRFMLYNWIWHIIKIWWTQTDIIAYLLDFVCCFYPKNCTDITVWTVKQTLPLNLCRSKFNIWPQWKFGKCFVFDLWQWELTKKHLEPFHTVSTLTWIQRFWLIFSPQYEKKSKYGQTNVW